MQPVDELDGLARRMPFTMLAFFLGACSVIGLPPMGGSWSKLYLATGAVASGQSLMMWVFMLSSLLSIGYLMPIVARAFLLPPRNDQSRKNDLRRAPLLVGPPVLTGVGCIALFFGFDALYQLLEGMFR